MRNNEYWLAVLLSLSSAGREDEEERNQKTLVAIFRKTANPSEVVWAGASEEPITRSVFREATG